MEPVTFIMILLPKSNIPTVTGIAYMSNPWPRIPPLPKHPHRTSQNPFKINEQFLPCIYPAWCGHAVHLCPASRGHQTFALRQMSPCPPHTHRHVWRAGSSAWHCRRVRDGRQWSIWTCVPGGECLYTLFQTKLARICEAWHIYPCAKIISCRSALQMCIKSNQIKSLYSAKYKDIYSKITE